MTKIEAVNRMLSAIQIRPVQSLEEPLDPIVAQAELMLDQELKSLLRKGWEFNLEDDRVFQHDSSTGEVAIPLDVLAIDFDGSLRKTERMTVRASKIWDAANRTFDIGKDLTLDVMVALNYADCPLVIQDTATWRAARRFYADVRGETQAIKELAFRESEAWSSLMREDINNADPHIMNSPLIARTITRRRRRWTWVS